MYSKLRKFDKVKDMTEVDPYGWCDLAEAYANGVVSPALTAAELNMNNIDDPESIVGKPSDEFDAIRLQNFVRERGVVAPESSESKDSD